MGTRRDTSSWLFFHDGMPEHPKIEGLSDKAFRTLVQLWCYCSRNLTDGYVDEKAWRKRTTPKVRRELIDAELVEVVPGDNSGDNSRRGDDFEGISTKSLQNSVGNGVLMHDYLDWQRSAEEAQEFSSKKAAAGSYGNHRRWHVDAGRWSQDCKFCVDDGPPKGSQTPSQVRSQVRSAEASQMRSQMGSQNDRREEKRRGGYVVGERYVSNARAPRCPDHAALPADAWVPPCGPCASRRQAAEALTAADRERAALCASSGRCDGLWLLEYPFGPPVEPAAKCDHKPRAVQANTG